jgi:hypothetical protein
MLFDVLLGIQTFLLGVESWWDFRARSHIPAPVALAPLAVGLVYGCLSGHVGLSLAVAFFTFLIFGMEYGSRWVPAALAAGGALSAAWFGSSLLALAFVLLTLPFLMNILAEADVIAIFGCLLLSPTPIMLLSLWTGLTVAIAICLACRYRAHWWIAVQTAFARLIRFQAPTMEELTAEGFPTVWGILLGLAFFCLQHPWPT